jgi:peroxiredoxin
MASSRQPRMLEPGTAAPGFSLARLEGGLATLSQLLSGGPLLLAFFKVSCPTCQLTFPFLERISKPGRLRFFGVSQDDAESTREFQREFGITFPMLLDSENENYPASNAYGISHVPSLFLIEPDGRVSWTSEGFSRKDIAALGAKAGAEPFREGESVPEHKSG